MVVVVEVTVLVLSLLVLVLVLVVLSLLLAILIPCPPSTGTGTRANLVLRRVLPCYIARRRGLGNTRPLCATAAVALAALDQRRRQW